MFLFWGKPYCLTIHWYFHGCWRSPLQLSCFKHNLILDTYVYINNPHWQSSGIIIFLCKYYIVTSDALVGSFVDVLFLLLAVISSELHEKPRRKDWVTEKRAKKNLCQGHHLFDLMPSFLCQFMLISSSTPSPL